MSKNKKILIVDDEIELRQSVRHLLQTLHQNQIEIVEAENGQMALEAIKGNNFDLVLMDVKMPEMDGLEALKAIKSYDPRIFVVIMTAHSNLQDAVEAIKSGAFDYIEKPIQPDKLQKIFSKAIDTQDMVSDLAVSNPIFDDDIDSEFVGASEKMHEVFNLINKISQVDATVLIRGENGTGKELVARAIHFNSPRKHAAMLSINCGAILENLVESEFFGHEKGAFTGAFERKIGLFQLANKGTLFLDEIAELKPNMQIKLLRALQERTFIPVGGQREVRTNARIIVATNQNLEKLIEEGKFRKDLFYRINVMPIFLPPLRERIDDIESLAGYFIKRFNKKYNKNVIGLNEQAMHIFKTYVWPGNIRELENAIEHAIVMTKQNLLTLENLPEEMKSKANNKVSIPLPYTGPMSFDKFKERAEREFIVSALKANKGKINKTVARANIPKNTLLRKIKKYEIDVKEYYTE